MSEQQDDSVIEQPWLENLKKNLDQFENSTLKIEAGATKVYEQVGNAVTVNKLQGVTARKVQQALENPQELKGSVKITLDGENVFHVKRGEVLEDKLPLTPITQAQSATSAQTVEANVENKPNITEQGIGVEPQEAEIEPQLESTATISQLEQTQHEPITLEPEAFDVQFEVLPALKSEVKKELSQPDFTPQSWNNVRDSIAQRQPQLGWAESAIVNLLVHQSQQLNELQQKVDSLQKLKPPLNAQVGQLFRSVKDVATNSIQQVKERAQQLPQDIKQFLGNKVSQVQQAVVERVDIASLAVSSKATQVHQAVVERIDTASLAISSKAAQVKDSVDQHLADVSAKALDKASRWLVNKFGKDLDGTGDKAWKGKDYTFTVSGENTSIANKNGQAIAKNGNLTAAATAQDAGKLSKLPQDVQQAAQKLQSQHKQVAGVGLKR